MSSRILSAPSQALSLVRKSNLIEATALIQRALSAGEIDLLNHARSSKLSSLSPAVQLPSHTSPETSLDPRPHGLLRHRKARKSQPTQVDTNPGTISNFTSRIYRHVERNLSYMLYVPLEVSGRERSLLLMLHGCRQSPDDFAAGTQMNRLADEFNIIVAYPLQPQTANSSGCWNWFDARHQKHGSGEPAMLAGLAESLRREFNIAKNLVFAAGLSAGGAMAEILASTYSQQFEAVGVHSGLPHGAATSLGNAFAAMKGASKLEKGLNENSAGQSRRIIFHGSVDAIVHPSNSERIVNQARSRSRQLKEVGLTKVVNGREVRYTIFQDLHGRSVVEQWLVKGGGHAWFGGNSGGSYTDPKGPDASCEMVRFFLRG